MCAVCVYPFHDWHHAPHTHVHCLQVSNLTNLQHLSIEPEQRLQRFPPALLNMPQLSSLRIKLPHTPAHGAFNIPHNTASALPHLRSLALENIAWNALEHLSSLSQLHSLELNHVEGHDGYATVLCHLSQLQELRVVSRNQPVLPECITTMTHLRYLSWRNSTQTTERLAVRNTADGVWHSNECCVMPECNA